MIAGSHVMMWMAEPPPGNDACRFALNSRSLLIEGSSRKGTDMATRYRVRATLQGETRRCRIERRDRRILIEREADGHWSMDGVAVPGVEGALDVDLGFSPATNTLPIRRLGLAVGEEARIMAAWLDPSDWTLKPMAQTYRRTGELGWHFSSPGVEVDLTVDGFGAVTRYPGHWISADVAVPADAG